MNELVQLLHIFAVLEPEHEFHMQHVGYGELEAEILGICQHLLNVSVIDNVFHATVTGYNHDIAVSVFFQGLCVRDMTILRKLNVSGNMHNRRGMLRWSRSDVDRQLHDYGHCFAYLWLASVQMFTLAEKPSAENDDCKYQDDRP